MTKRSEKSIPAQVIYIRSDEDAWRYLKAAINNEKLPERVQLIFDGWPSFKVKVKGKDWNGTVPTRVMSPLLDLQKDVHRLFAQINYGTEDLRKINDQDKDILELIVSVKKGSSDYDAPIDAQLTELGKIAIDKMESKHLMITLLGAALVWGGVEVSKSLIASKQAEKHVEQTVELSKQETERLKIFAKAVEQRPVVGSVRSDFEVTQNKILKTLKPGDEIGTQGVTLNSAQAAAITHSERSGSKDLNLDEDFYVLANDASRASGFRIKLHRLSDGKQFLADVPIELSQDEQSLIQAAEWSRSSRRVRLQIQAVERHGRITQATVYGAQQSDTKSAQKKS